MRGKVKLLDYLADTATKSKVCVTLFEMVSAGVAAGKSLPAGNCVLTDANDA
jgi:hypothetical protein